MKILKEIEYSEPILEPDLSAISHYKQKTFYFVEQLNPKADNNFKYKLFEKKPKGELEISKNEELRWVLIRLYKSGKLL